MLERHRTLGCARVPKSMFRLPASKHGIRSLGVIRSSSLPSPRGFHSSTILLQPRTRHSKELERHEDAEPLRPEDLLNPSGRIYSPRAGRESYARDPLQEAVREGLDRHSIAELRSRLNRAKRPSFLWATFSTLAISYACYAMLAGWSVSESKILKDKETASFWPNLAGLWAADEMPALTAEERRLRVVRREALVEKAQASARSIAKLCDQLMLSESFKTATVRLWLNTVSR